MHTTEKLSEKDQELNNLLETWTSVQATPELIKLVTESVPCVGFARPIVKEQDHAA